LNKIEPTYVIIVVIKVYNLRLIGDRHYFEPTYVITVVIKVYNLRLLGDRHY